MFTKESKMLYITLYPLPILRKTNQTDRQARQKEYSHKEPVTIIMLISAIQSPAQMMLTIVKV